MTGDQLEVAAQLTDELVKVGVLLLSPSPAEIKAITPLLVWAYIDDYLMHGPTYERTARAMQALMD
jgi:hypothetical protein